MTTPTGTIIAGRYRVDRYLGSGGYGEVYAVIDLHQSASVALKLLGPAVEGTWHEAQVLTALRSDYILPVWNADVDAGVAFLVTALAEHGSADRHVASPGVPPATAIRWVRAAARGAARTHQVGLLHRDIKPDNVFLTDTGEALLGDFGIAVLMDAAGQAPAHGTLTTQAPEVVAGESTSVASDVYSLGATLYALLTCSYAHLCSDADAMAARIINDEPVPLRDLAPHLSQALSRRVQIAMAKKPDERYPTAAEFDAALGELPAPARTWARTDEHGGHLACWRGVKPGNQDACVCLEAVDTRAVVTARHQPSGRRIAAACRGAAAQSVWPRNLRSAMSDVP